MTDSLVSLRERAQAIFPELSIEQVERNEEGLINDVLIVNQQLVFRFARNEAGQKTLEIERKILDTIRGRVNVAIPAPIYQDRDCMVYPLLKGEPLSRKQIITANQAAQLHIAEQLGVFLQQIHQIDGAQTNGQIPATQAPTDQQTWLDFRVRVREKIYPLVQGYQINWIEDLFQGFLNEPTSFEYPLALIHGDFATYHILCADHGHILRAVIDFGMAGMGDPATDFGGLINIYGETFIQQMRPVYPHLDLLLPRARFYAQALELQWIMRGLESGETFWFTAHLGGARDIHA